MKKLVLIILLFPVTARADYHYASHEGSDEYPYSSWETAADSIQQAIDAAEAGDTIYVGSGVWEDVPLILWDSLSLVGMGIDSTVLQKGYHSEFINFIDARNYVLIQGFTFNGMDVSYPHCAVHGRLHRVFININNNKFMNLHVAIIMANNSGEIVNNLFLNNEQAVDAAFAACSLLVKSNTITGCTEMGIQGSGGNWTVINNLFHHNPSPTRVLELAFQSESDTGYVASNLFYRNREGQGHLTGSEVTIVGSDMINNTLIGPYTRGQQRAIRCGPPLPVSSSRNNTISDYGYAFATSFGTVLNVSYNNIWDVDGLDIGDGEANYLEGNIFVDPMFQDTTSFRLQAYSPLIDAGDPNILDVDGTRSDMGVYGGPLGQSYPYLDLPPRIADSLQAAVRSDSIIITWRYNTESDFNRYQLYRDTLSGFEPSVFNMIAEPDTSYYADTDWTPDHDYFYRLAAIDNQDNISGYSDELAVLFTGVGGFDNDLVARVTTIETNYPNPFNARTKIDYYLADVGYQPASVRLYIYNISGQLVKKLVDERQYPGEHNIVWDGLDERGESLSSGIYFARLIVSGVEISKPRKIVLMK